MFKKGHNMSFRINEFQFNNKNVVLSYQDVSNENHTFTIITGKNSVGKSRLLTKIINHYLKKNKIITSFNYLPSKIICVTNIQFDKFPLSGYKRSIPYDYFGRRNRNKFSNYDRYIFIKSIITKSNINAECIKSTFEYLNFKSEFKVVFEKNISSSFRINEIFSTTLEKVLDIYKMFFRKNIKYIGNISRFYELLDYTQTKTSKLKNIFNGLFEDPSNVNQQNPTLTTYKNIFMSLDKFEKFFILCIVNLYKNDITLSEEDFNTLFKTIIINNHQFDDILKPNIGYESNYSINKELQFLLKFNLIKIKDLIFISKDEEKYIEFDDLSSGQQSILNIYLSISSSIENNSLICIDEPEISLHPEWQTEFIIKLQEIFNFYYGCHFLIATHSPQIVAGLKLNNGYILDLEKNQTHKSIDFSKRSADYQLAKVFNSPGFNNEYLIRIALTLLSKISNKKPFNDEDNSNFEILLESQKMIPENDPVYYLIEQINSLV